MVPERARKQVLVRANIRLRYKDFIERTLITWYPEYIESDGFLGS